MAYIGKESWLEHNLRPRAPSHRRTQAGDDRCPSLIQALACASGSGAQNGPSRQSSSHGGPDAAFQPQGRGQGHDPSGRARSRPLHAGSRRCWPRARQQGQCAAQGGAGAGQGPCEQGVAPCCERLRKRGCCARQALQVVSNALRDALATGRPPDAGPHAPGALRSDWTHETPVWRAALLPCVVRPRRAGAQTPQPPRSTDLAHWALSLLHGQGRRHEEPGDLHRRWRGACAVPRALWRGAQGVEPAGHLYR